MVQHYEGREQSATKHFILRGYLEQLAFKVLFRNWDALTFVDAFSGPWESQAEDYSDTSFMIALETLAKVRKDLAGRGRVVQIRCFFTERSRKAFKDLERVVDAFSKREPHITIQIRNAEFLDVIDEAVAFSTSSFRLSFIDPTGWTGFAFPKLSPLLQGRASETLINYMYDFINRAVAMEEPKTRASLEPILGENWWEKLPPGLPRGEACEQVFRSNLKDAGGFRFVISTRIDRVSADRPHFFLAYGTNSFAGVKAFRNTERSALSQYGEIRAIMKSKKSGDQISGDLFSQNDLPVTNPFDKEIQERLDRAAEYLVEHMFAVRPAHKFDYIVLQLLSRFPIKETEVKDICVRLAEEGVLQDTWTAGRTKKPSGDMMIKHASFSG